MTPLLDKKYLLNISKKGGNGFYDSSNGINGIGTLATDFIEVISSLTTRNYLQGMTMISWSHVLPSRGLMRTEKAWCPECLQVALDNEEPIYEQLVWTLKIVSICTIHRIKLSTHCPYCSKKMSVLSRNGKPGSCSTCERWLGEKGWTPRIDDNSEDIKKTILILQMMIPNSNTMYRREQISESLKFYVEQLFGGNIKKAAEYFKVANATFRDWYKGRTIPPLNSLVSICLRLDISVVNFFNKVPVLELNNILDAVSSPTKTDVRQKYDHVYIKSYINKYIQQESITSPKSLRSIATSIGCDRRLLYIKYPTESKKIVDIYAKYLKREKTKREENVDIEMKVAIEKLVNSDTYPSRRKVETLLGGRYLIRERKVALKWKSIK
ncbi:TniQ family protein [Oceanobacillus massiliensis]|uniref:TniQ family protein n=2 Tax=Oceanobacillus massiliensis TaxID=1465765 RepID=UPI0028FC78F0|nr:TniQ family protein [Oceanobacillus massiliensis]